MRPTLRLAALVLPAALLAACGGGDSGQAGNATPAMLGGAVPPAAGESAAAATDLAAIDAAGGAAGAAAAGVPAARAILGAPPPPAPVAQPNPDGAALTVSTAGFIDTGNPFFTPMGNGRSCATCHAESAGWSVTPQGLLQRFNQSAGADPIFRLVDGANSPAAATGTLDQKRLAYSMLLTKGLIRVGLAMPANAEFTLARVNDPYGHASANELSLFRRPMPSTNLKFISSVMWDGRETTTATAGTAGANCVANAAPALCYASVDSSLLAQASDAVRGHAEAARELSPAAQRAIVDFESGLFTAQQTSGVAGSLFDAGATGGPLALSGNAFYFGINDLEAGDYRSNAPFTRNVMTMFGAWRNLDAPARPAPGQRPQPATQASAQNVARASIARGEALFNNRPFNLTRVAGFTDTLRAPARVSCASCHSAPNAGSHSVPLLVDIGVADARFRTPDMPLYTLRNNATGETLDTTDPGQAMLTGRWRDIGKMKVPVLRGLSARAPYFHNGSQADLAGVVRFYDRRFQIGLTQQEVADLTAFLKAL
ncbi:cytochrome C [Pseudoduganella namucuonensis]|uniref:Di-haem cytochrome c peroxidase n=1 Tax=Pseudoduganella namucuonensis TaxID=1035707 RepID=A0A1I7JRK3_9BURK|nr:cytochrome C [Pseudoduganella namucuonensis]SFU87758.1 Di-haem cytochrome c peroxidase [Pseudoduganella namucuonensis]